MQDAAYGTLLRGVRRELHGRIADTLVSIFPDQAAVAPELIAKHLEGAERPIEAIERWQEAGDQQCVARQRSRPRLISDEPLHW